MSDMQKDRMRNVSVGTQVLLLSEQTAQKREDPSGTASCLAAAPATGVCTWLLLHAKSSGLLQRERGILPQGACILRDHGHGYWRSAHSQTSREGNSMHIHKSVVPGHYSP